MIRARDRVVDSEAGVSLVELVVASVVGLLLMSLMSAMFLQITRSTTNAQTTKANTAIAWTVSDAVTRVVRQGVQVQTSASVTEGAVVAGSTATSLLVDSNVDATVVAGQVSIAPTRVTFAVVNGNLTEKRQSAALSNGYFAFTGTPKTRTVGGPIVTTGTGTDALFTYWKGTDQATQVVPQAGGLTKAEADSVTAVMVNVTVTNDLTTGADPVRLTNKVTMPNIAIVNGGN